MSVAWGCRGKEKEVLLDLCYSCFVEDYDRCPPLTVSKLPMSPPGFTIRLRDGWRRKKTLPVKALFMPGAMPGNCRAAPGRVESSRPTAIRRRWPHLDELQRRHPGMTRTFRRDGSSATVTDAAVSSVMRQWTSIAFFPISRSGSLIMRQRA